MQDTQIYQPPEKSIFLDLLNTDALLERYEHNLRGEVLVTQTKTDSKTGRQILAEDWQARYRQKMTDEGINSVMSMLRTICDKSMSMTDLSEEQIDILVKQNTDAWLDFLCVNALDFGLSSPDKISEVYRPARNLIITKFRSSVNGMMVNAVSKTTNVSEQHIINPEQPNAQQPSGFLGKIGIKI